MNRLALLAERTSSRLAPVQQGATFTCKVSGGEGKVGGTVTFTFSEANGTINTQSVKTT